MTKEKWVVKGGDPEAMRSSAYYSLGVLAGAGYMALQEREMDADQHLENVRAYLRWLEAKVPK